MKSHFGATSFLLVAFMTLLPLTASAQKVTINVTAAKLSYVIEELQKQVPYKFAYNNSFIDVNRKVTVNAENRELKEVLNQLFKDTDITWEIKSNSIILKLKSFSSSDREITIKGTVTDGTYGEPLPFVTIMIPGTNITSISDNNGHFSITAPANQTLIFSFLGYRTVEIPINDRTVINVTLFEEAQSLEDVIVVAYGTQKREAITGSATAIGSEKIEKRIVPNLTNALEGLSAGVQVTSSGGPGENSGVRIRGFGSISASSSPLYVVDGAPFDGSLNSISPQDIESMTVLKDAASAALYGSRAANGVIMITTKKAKTDKISINYNFNGGWQDRAIPRYGLVSQRDFVNMNYEALRNAYVFKNGWNWDAAGEQASKDLSGTLGGEIYNPFKNYTWETLIDPATGLVHEDAISAYDEDWLEEVTHHNAFRQEHQLALMGGSKNIKALMSIGYLNQDGILKNSGFQRYSGRANVEIQATEWLKGGLNLSASNTKSTGQASDGTTLRNVWYSAQFMPSIYPVFMKDENGKDLLDELGNRQYDYGKTRPRHADRNSIGTMFEDLDERKNDNAGIRTFLTVGSDKDEFGWAKGLKFTVNFNADYRARVHTEYDNMYHGDASKVGGRLDKTSTRLLSYTFNQLLTYDRTFDGHTIGVLAGHEYYNYNYAYLTAQKTGLVDGILELRPGTMLTKGDSYSNVYRIESWLGRLNYDYADKYFLSASIRTDGSSRFHKDSRWGVFWSVGANWNIKHENWMRNVDCINNLALRTSYGVQGNDDVGLYAWQSFYSTGYANSSMNGVLVSTLENRNVKWEKNENLNIGLDVRLFNNIIDFGIEYYRKYTKDMLLEYPMAISTGFSGYNANIGNMVNNGVEFTLGLRLLNKRDFQWDIHFMGSTTHNKVLKLTETEQMIHSTYVIEVGKPLHTFYLAKNAGINPANGSRLYWVYDLAEGQEKVKWDGDIPVDDNGNPLKVYRSSDIGKATASKWYFGSRMPKIYGSLSTDMHLFNLVDISVLTTYSLGGKILDGLYNSAMNPGNAGDIWHKNALRRWRQPGDVTDVPRSQIGASRVTNDSNLIDASYFAIKNLTVGFRLPDKYTKKIKATKCRIYVALDNFATFTYLDGMDPQYNFTGGTDYTYTPNKAYSIGLNIGF